MAPPYRDRIAKISWTEKEYVGATLLSAANDFNDEWYNLPEWAAYNTDGGGTFFPAVAFYPPEIVYLNGFRLGSHTPITEYVEGHYPALGAAGTRVRVKGQFNWTYYAWAVTPDVRVRVYANGEVFNNWPAAFTWEDGMPTDFEIICDLDGSGDLRIKMAIEEDDGIGSTSLEATLVLESVEELPCDGVDKSYSILTPYPLEEVRAYAKPRAGSVWHRYPSGERDAWLTGHDGVLEADVRWIPAVSALTLPDNDGWEDRDDAGTVRGGWGRFLRHALRGGAFTFYPDAADAGVSRPCVWAGDLYTTPELEEDMERSLRFAIRTTDGSDFDGYSQ